MPILVPKGNTRVGEVAGQFILRNKQMALEKAIAQQRAALEAARIRVSRENAEAARQDAAADRALRREGMEMRSKESALERQARSEESRLSRALQKDIAEGGWDVRREEGKASREQAKALADAQISATREEGKETRKFQEKMSKARTEAERKTLMDKEARRLNVSLPEDATYEEKQKILADAGRQKEWNDRQQRKQDLYTSQGGTYNPVPYGSAPFAEALADLEARKGIRKAKQEDEIAREKRRGALEMAMIHARRAPVDMSPQQQVQFIEKMKMDYAQTTGQDPEAYGQRLAQALGGGGNPVRTSPAPASRATQTGTAARIKQSEDDVGELSEEDYELAKAYSKLAKSNIPWGVKNLSGMALEVADWLDPFGQGGSAALLSPAAFEVAKKAGAKQGLTEEDLMRMRDRYGRAFVPSEWGRTPRYK